eukprot:1306270-Amphidinium_carterae.1
MRQRHACCTGHQVGTRSPFLQFPWHQASTAPERLPRGHPAPAVQHLKWQSTHSDCPRVIGIALPHGKPLHPNAASQLLVLLQSQWGHKLHGTTESRNAPDTP